MKRKALLIFATLLGLLLSGAVLAYAQCGWGQWGGRGMGHGSAANIENVKKYQKETLSLRDELMTKNLELQNEYNKPAPDTNRIGTLRKEIIDLETKIETIADKYRVAPGGSMGYGMRGRGMMGPGMMGSGMGWGCYPCGW